MTTFTNQDNNPALPNLLNNFYRMERVKDSAWKKRFRANDKDLQSLVNHTQKIRDLVLDAFSMQGNASLMKVIEGKSVYMTMNTLPTRPYADELATAALYSIAKALEARNDVKLAQPHIAQACELLKGANNLADGDDWHEVGAEIQGLTERNEELREALTAKTKKAAKGGATSSRTPAKEKAIAQLVPLINKHLDVYRAAYKEAYHKPLPNTATPLCKFLIPILKDCKKGKEGFMGLSLEATATLSGNVLIEALLQCNHCKG